VLAAFALLACFHDVGRLSFAGEGERETLVRLEPGDVHFAADVSVRYTGDAMARYDVDLLQRDKVVGRTTCDPLQIAWRPRSCSYGVGPKNFDCEIIMACKAHLDAGGWTRVRARLSLPKKPPKFELSRADLIFGQ
jgi:hypothetical protein